MNFLLIDAFADRPFAGNPAAVVLLPRPAPDDWLQSLAMEFNQAETAYLLELCGQALITAQGTLRALY